MTKRRSSAVIAAEMEVLRAEVVTLNDKEETTEEDIARSTEALDEFKTLRVEYDTAVKYEDDLEAVRSAALNPKRVEGGDGAKFAAPNVITRTDPFSVLDDRSMGGRELQRALVDSNLRAIEGRVEVSGDDEKHFETVLRSHVKRQGGVQWASNVLARSRPEYEDAWAKMITGNSHMLSEIERAAMAVGTNTAGGFLVPSHLDPTLMLTNAGSDNVMRQLARKVTLIDGSVWKGVTTAGVTASFDAELAEVSDDTPAVAQPTITVYKAQAFVQASIESFEDIANLASDVLMLFADARDRLEGSEYMTGAGSSGPKGLFTAINASASLKTTSTTAATIGEVDIHALYRALPKRWRGKGSFVANPLYTLAVKRLGTAVSSSYQGDFTVPVSDRWLGRPVHESDDAPTTQTTTALDQEIVFADLSQFIIVDKPGGFSIEFVPHLFNTSNNLPDGRRGWYAYWRTGSDMPNLAAGRILVDKTSA